MVILIGPSGRRIQFTCPQCAERYTKVVPMTDQALRKIRATGRPIIVLPKRKGMPAVNLPVITLDDLIDFNLGFDTIMETILNG